MITIRPSTVTDDATLPPDDAASTEEHKKRMPLIWIPATLGVGLLIAAVYLGGRIVKARPSGRSEMVNVLPPASLKAPIEIQKATPPPPAKTAPATEQPATAPARKAATPEPLTVVTPGDDIPMIQPQAGERYIQVGALNQEATRRFVERLRNEKLEPHVAPGPKPELMRVLIGPFDNRDSLNEKKAQLANEGIDTFIRQY